MKIRRPLFSVSTESAFSVETACRKVKRWHAVDLVECWVGSGLLVVERQLHRTRGHREIAALLAALANAGPTKSVAGAGAVA